MKKTFVLALAFVGIASVASAQTNPCRTAVGNTHVFQPGAMPLVYVEAPQVAQNDPSGNPIVVSVEVGVFAQGVNPAQGQPVSSVAVPRSSLTPVTGFTGCYQAQVPMLLAAPVATFTPYFGATRAINQVGPSGWTSGNPFWLAGVPAAPANTRVGQ